MTLALESFSLPPSIVRLVAARNELRDHFSKAELRFTFDGNLVGDIGEAVAAEQFGITLIPRCGAGIDGHAPDGRTVQVKATGSRLGPAFRQVDTRADHLLFYSFDFENCVGEVVYNGPEHLCLEQLPATWTGQRSLSWSRICRLNSLVEPTRRLPRL